MMTTITIRGTHCPACKGLLEDVCQDIPGVKACTVDFHSGQTDIEYDERLDWEALQTEINALGPYQVKI